MKRFISVFFSAALFFLNVSFNTFAEETVGKVYIDSATGKVGETIDVAVGIENNQGIISLVAEISYDTNALKLTGVKKNNDFWASANMTPGGDLSAQPYRIIWYDGLAKSDFTESGTLAELSFEILKEGSHNVDITISDSDTFNCNFEPAYFECESGSISVKSEASLTTTLPTTTTTETTTSTATSSTTTTTSETTTSLTTTTTTFETTTSTTTSSTTTTTSETTTSTTTTSTTSETTTSTTQTTTTTEAVSEATTTTNTINASPYEIANWAENDYYKKTSIEPYKSEYKETVEGILTVTLYDESGKVLDVYNVSMKSGIGTNSNGEEVNLPQTGNNSLLVLLIEFSALLLIVVGLIMVIKSKKIVKDDK